jgi:hypothetical protein
MAYYVINISQRLPVYRLVETEKDLLEDLRLLLDRMMRKGIILTFEEGHSETHYANAEFAMGGIFNFQLNNLTEDLLTDYHQYQAEKRKKERTGTGGGLPLRTIPIEKSLPIPDKFTVYDYDSVRKLVENTRVKLSVANCICRLTSQILGDGCKKRTLSRHA